VKVIFITFFGLFTSIVHAQSGFNVELLDHWTDTTRIKGPEDAIFSDVWGFSVNGRNYAALGSTEGTHILKIENNQIEEVDFKAGKFSSLLVQHRDYKTYKNYLYAVCDEGQSSLQIFDLSYLPDSITTVYDSDYFFKTSHNIFIDTNKAKLYVCAPNNIGLRILDISNPILPQLYYDFNGVGYVHDCYVTNDTAFLNCGFSGLQIYNFSTLPAMQLGLMDFYAGQGYNHSGWLSEDRKKYVFIDETQGKKLKICNSESLINIEVSSLYGTKDYEDYVAHNVQIYSDFAFVSYYNEGLRIVDIKTNKPDEVAYYDMFWQDTKYKLNGMWGVYVFEEDELILASDRQNGLFLFHFPIKLYRNIQDQSLVTNSPFIDQNSKIIFQSDQSNSLYFTIYTSNGKKVYKEEALKDWVNVPLNLPDGVYVYAIRNTYLEVIASGKFVVTN